MDVIPILQKAGPLSREDNLAIHNAFMTLRKTEQKSEGLVKAFCDVRLPFVFEAMRFYIQINPTNAIQHFHQALLRYGQDLVQMASYNKKDNWTLCAYVVQTSFTKDLILPEEHIYFSELVQHYTQELDATFIDLNYRCWTPAHSHEWHDSNGFVTAPPTTSGAPLFIGDVVDDRTKSDPLSVRRNFGALSPTQRFLFVLSHMKVLMAQFRELHAKIHMPVWSHTHTWKHNDNQLGSVKLMFTISVAHYNPELKLSDVNFPVYDLPNKLEELEAILMQKLAQPAAPHTHKIHSTAGHTEKDNVYFGLNARKGIGAVKNV